MRCVALLLLLASLLCPPAAWCASDSFPSYEAAPAYTSYFADGTPNHVWHIRPTTDSPAGSDSNNGTSYATACASLTGLVSKGVVAGDLILYHQGTYTQYSHSPNSGESYKSNNELSTSGTSADRIVILAANQCAGYESETTPIIHSTGDEGEHAGMGMSFGAYQVVDGIHFQTCISIYRSHIVVQNCEFSLGGSGQRDGNSATILFPAQSPYAGNVTIRNNSFHDPDASHPQDEGASTATRCYALVMFESNTSDGGDTWNGGYTRIYYNRFYNWNDPGSQEFIVYCKDRAHGTEIAYNRFYNSSADATGSFGQGGTITGGWSVHHNLVYNCYGLAYLWGAATDAEWHDNVVIDSGASFTTYGFRGTDVHESPTVWGQVWNNILQVDDPGEWLPTASPSGYGWFTWVDYNAYPSATVQGYFENALSAASDWQQHDQTSIPTITIDGNYFATVPDSYPYQTSGRYGDVIGGFTFGESTPAPPTLSNVTISNGSFR